MYLNHRAVTLKDGFDICYSHPKKSYYYYTLKEVMSGNYLIKNFDTPNLIKIKIYNIKLQ